jgi:ADP-ribose pyrophosphatase YjhB (NUDIX family)
MNFCSHCGSPNLSFRIPESDNRPRLACLDCHAVHYTNPRVVVGCLPVWEDKFLLCRRAIEPRKGLWNLPAGFLEIGETLEQGAVREMQEEAAAAIQIRGLHCIHSNIQHEFVYIFFWGELIDGKFGAGEESLESSLFSRNEIPWKEIAFYSTKYALECYLHDLDEGAKRVHIDT